MNSKKQQVSYCVPVYNEESVLLPNLEKLEKELLKIFGKYNYEILVVDNGSTDKTPQLLKSLKNKNIRGQFLPKKGHGLAYKTGIKHARFDHVVLSAIDLPFGVSDVKKAIKLWDTNDIIYGSKAHPKSKTFINGKRKFASAIYRTFLRLLFWNLRIRDVQGSVFMKRQSIKPILKYCTAENAFFTAQLAIYGTQAKLRMVEVPVVMKKSYGTRKSKYSIFRDGKQMLKSLLVERYNILNAKF